MRVRSAIAHRLDVWIFRDWQLAVHLETFVSAPCLGIAFACSSTKVLRGKRERNWSRTHKSSGKSVVGGRRVLGAACGTRVAKSIPLTRARPLNLIWSAITCDCTRRPFSDLTSRHVYSVLSISSNCCYWATLNLCCNASVLEQVCYRFALHFVFIKTSFSGFDFTLSGSNL